GLATGAVLDRLHAVADVGGLEGLAYGLDIGIGRVAVRQFDARLLEGGGVDQHGNRVGAEAEAIELAVDLAALDLVLVEIVELQHAADKLIERGDGVARRVFDD